MGCWESRSGGSRGGRDESSPPVPLLSLRERGNAGPASVVPRPGRPAADGMRPARSDRGRLQELHRVRSTGRDRGAADRTRDRKSTRLNSSHGSISYAVFCLKKKKNNTHRNTYIILIRP